MKIETKTYPDGCSATGPGPLPDESPLADVSKNTTVDQLMCAAFVETVRDPRSAEYKAGCRAALTRHLHGHGDTNPHEPGTAQADAWWGGEDEGHRIWRQVEAARPIACRTQPT